MKNLLFVTNNLYQLRGGEKWALELSRELRGKFRIEILFPNAMRSSRRARSEIGKYGITYSEIRGSSFKSKISTTQYDFFMPSLPGFSSISSAIARTDIVYCISSNPAIISTTILLAKLYKKRIIYGIHNPLFSTVVEGKRTSKLNRLISKSLLGKVDAFHALNTYDYKIAVQEFPRSKVHLIPNFISNPTSTSKITVNKKKFIVLFVGKQLKLEKGLDFLSEIIKATLSKNKEIHFHIIGPEGDSDELLRMLTEKYPNNVKVMGLMAEEELNKQYFSADLFALTSRKETFGLALLEAQSHGIPAICFDVGGPSDIITEEFQGMIIRKFDTREFSGSVLKYHKKWQDKQRYLIMKKKISKEVNLRYCKSSLIPKLVELLVG